MIFPPLRYLQGFPLPRRIGKLFRLINVDQRGGVDFVSSINNLDDELDKIIGNFSIEAQSITSSSKCNEDVKLSLIHISEPTRLGMISYAVFCLKKKKKKKKIKRNT